MENSDVPVATYFNNKTYQCSPQLFYIEKYTQSWLKITKCVTQFSKKYLDPKKIGSFSLLVDFKLVVKQD